MDLDRLEQAVKGDLARETGAVAWLRSRRRPARVAVLAIALSAGALVFLAVKPRVDLGTYPAARLAAILGVYGLLALGAAWIALRPLHLPPLRLAVERGWVALAFLAPLAAAMLPELETHPGPAARYDTAGHAVICFATGSAIGLAVVLLASLLDRRGLRSLGVALLAAAAGGIAGVTALQIECPFNYRMHLILGHASVPVGLAIVYGRGRRIITR